MELNKIYNEDCIEGMKKIPDGSIDLICTDPPYCVGATSTGVKGTFTDLILIQPFFKELFDEWQRILKDGGHLYICTDWRTYPLLYSIMQKYFQVRNLIVWDYGWIKAGNFYRFTHEFIMFATKGKSKRQFEGNKENSDIWRIKTINYTSTNKLHPSEKPVELFEKMIVNSSNEGDVILDGFIGSGTTAVAAINTGRNFIGFELDENYFDVANERIAKVLNEKSSLNR